MNNAWNWDNISFDLPLSIKLEVQTTPFAIAIRREDRLAWKTNSHGKFDLSSAYKLATPNDEDQVFRGHWIWKERINPRIQFFLWKCFHNSIGVNVCLNARGINLDPLCPRCKKEPETIIHMLRDCTESKEIWERLGISVENGSFFSSDLHTWLTTNAAKNQVIWHNQPPWKIVFMHAIWLLWKQRNKFIFQSTNFNPNLTVHIVSQASEFHWYATDWKAVNRFIMKDVRWERPRRGWWKLNTDGSSLGNPGLAGGGGILRDEMGSWVLGFSRNIGVTSSFEAKLWALRDGLTICVEKSYSTIEVELDAKAIIDILLTPSQAISYVSPLLEDCRQLASQILRI